jgi:hypothetical protein
MACTGLISFIAGVTGYFVAQAGGVYLLEPLASEVPRAKHVAFLADLWAHDAAYVAGIIGCAALCIWTWRRRRLLGRAASGTTSSNPPFRPESASTKRWQSVTLRLLSLVGCCSLVLGVLFILVISALSGI